MSTVSSGYDAMEFLHSVSIVTITSVSLFSNCLLLFIIYTTKMTQLGGYRYLLALLAVGNMATSLGHASLQPYVHMTSSGFYLFPKNGGIVIFDVPFDTILCVMFLGTYYQNALVLVFQFMYRYKVVSRGLGSSCTDYWKTSQWTMAAVVAYFLYMDAYLMAVELSMTPFDNARDAEPSAIDDVYGVNLSDPTTGYLAVSVRMMDPATKDLHWNGTSLMSLAISISLFGVAAAIIVFCIYQTNNALNSSNTPITPAARMMNRHLFSALLIQASVPFIFTYASLFVMFLFGPMAGISLGVFGNILILASAISSSVTAFLVLYYIDKYRVAVIILFQLPLNWGMEPME